MADKLRREDGWEPVTLESVGRDLVYKYLNPSPGEFQDFFGYKTRSGENGVEVVDENGSCGYAFVGELQIDRDVEGRLNQIRRMHEAEGRVIERLFLDLRPEERIAGLMWRKK